jgi:hypothetical protein
MDESADRLEWRWFAGVFSGTDGLLEVLEVVLEVVVVVKSRKANSRFLIFYHTLSIRSWFGRLFCTTIQALDTWRRS